MSRPGVLFVHSATRPPLGADTFVHSLVIGALDRGAFDVHVACAPGARGAPTPTQEIMSKIPGIRLHPVNLGRELFRASRVEKARAAISGLAAVSSFADLVRLVRRHGIRVLHTSDRPRDALVCALLARVTGAKYVIHVHVAYGEWMSPMLKWSMRHADALIGVSDFVVRTLVDGGYDARRSHSVLNAIDLSRWDPATEAAGVRESLGIPATAKVVACVARVFRAKGQVELVQALATVKKKVPDAVVLIVGQDYPPGTNHSEELRELAQKLGVEGSLFFAGQRKDVARLLAASDVLCMPSYEEPFGLVYVEAMAMLRPVVAFGDGGTVEVVEHGRSGLLAKPGDLEELAQHLVTLLSDPGLCARMGRYGREQAETRFVPARLARDVEAVYRQLL